MFMIIPAQDKYVFFKLTHLNIYILYYGIKIDDYLIFFIIKSIFEN